MSLFCSILRRSCFCHPLRLLIPPYAQGHANFSCPKNFKLIRQTAVSFCYRHLSEFSPVFSCPVTRPNGAEPDVIQVLLRQKTGRLRRLKPCQEFHPNSIVVKYRNSQEFWLSSFQAVQGSRPGNKLQKCDIEIHLSPLLMIILTDSHRMQGVYLQSRTVKITERCPRTRYNYNEGSDLQACILQG